MNPLKSAIWLTVAFWLLHTIIVAARVELTLSVPLVAVLPRLATLTLGSLVYCILCYLALERLQHIHFARLITILILLAAAGSLMTTTTFVVGYQFLAGRPHPDAMPSRFFSVSTYWMWLYVVWALAITALLYRHSLGLHRLSQAAEPAFDEEIWVTHRKRRFRITLSRIISLQAAGDYVVIHSLDGDYMTHGSLTTFGRQLRSRAFMRVHRGAIVNLDAVAEIERNAAADLTLHLSDGSAVKVGRSFKRDVRSTLAAHSPALYRKNRAT